MGHCSFASIATNCLLSFFHETTLFRWKFPLEHTRKPTLWAQTSTQEREWREQTACPSGLPWPYDHRLLSIQRKLFLEDSNPHPRPVAIITILCATPTGYLYSCAVANYNELDKLNFNVIFGNQFLPTVLIFQGMTELFRGFSFHCLLLSSLRDKLFRDLLFTDS